MDDIAPELYERLKRGFEARLAADKSAATLYDKIQNGSSAYADAQSYAEAVGQALAGSFQANLSSEDLPDGRMYYNIAKRTVEPLLQEDYEIVSAASEAVQQSLNEAAGIHLRAQEAEFDQDRADGIIDRLSDAERYDDVAWILGRPVVNFSQAVVADTIEENAGFQASAGLSPKIVRTCENKACAWCRSLAGTYDYPAPKEVYQRHEDCSCVVEYYPGDGRVQNSHTRQWREERREQERQERIAQIENTPFKTHMAVGAMAQRIYVKDEITLEDDVHHIVEGTYVTGVKVIASGEGIRDVNRLINTYKLQNGELTKADDWFKVRGRATVEDDEGNVRSREIHWYQGVNIGKVEFKFPSNPRQV